MSEIIIRIRGFLVLFAKHELSLMGIVQRIELEKKLASIFHIKI